MAPEVAGHLLRSIVHERNHWSTKTCPAVSKKIKEISSRMIQTASIKVASRKSQVSSRKASMLKMPTDKLDILCCLFY